MLLGTHKDLMGTDLGRKVVSILVVGLAAFGAGMPVHAANQYWVSLGSYSKLSGAERLSSQASANFSQISIVPSESPMGLVYRVIDGPVNDRATANQRLEQAKMLGYPSAWLVIKDSSEGVPEAITSSQGSVSDQGLVSETYTDGSSYESSDTTATYETSSYQSDYSSTDYSSAEATTEYSTTSYATEDYNTVPIGKQELVDEAPANYGLHRLRRDNTGVGPIGQSEESRLKELYPQQDQN